MTGFNHLRELQLLAISHNLSSLEPPPAAEQSAPSTARTLASGSNYATL